MPKITIHNLKTNEVIEREMNEAEYQQHLLDEAEGAEIIFAKAEKEAKRLAALAKLKELGLDENDLKALGL